MTQQLLPDYSICPGTNQDRSLLIQFMQESYREIFPEQNFAHLTRTVEQYFSRDTPLWWVEESQNSKFKIQNSKFPDSPVRAGFEQRSIDVSRESFDKPAPTTPDSRQKVACLWVGNAVDQVKGDRHTYIFLLYVKPEHRQRGIGKALMRYLEDWARTKGDRQIGLQVFQSNTLALDLYHKLGYQIQSHWMIKTLEEGSREQGTGSREE
ncbi:GNAT family N-acetyltransferase [Scytonema millei]|uniref:GNAT family N-acetyltransferase n=1 Tax=Scytonema millei VB511283 TaxID=1245923 RepID=A0A9X5E7T2_9CYAN|nr:GNAT family N-acetyltransferase [Scytonema millei]NHC36950.1 GNAT family N-acetyltransferase [Scytonema millei VB511283]